MFCRCWRRDVAQAPELCIALVGEAEANAKGPAGQPWASRASQLGVGAQDLQHAAVALPQEPEPRRHQLTVGAVL